MNISVAHTDNMLDQNELENNRKEAVEAYLQLLSHHWPAGAEANQITCQNNRSQGGDVHQKPPEYTMPMCPIRPQVPSHCPPWQDGSCSACKEIPTTKVNKILTRSCHWTIIWASLIHTALPNPTWILSQYTGYVIIWTTEKYGFNSRSNKYFSPLQCHRLALRTKQSYPMGSRGHFPRD